MPRKTKTCPDCKGAKQVQGYYTMPPHDCETCHGEGVVPVGATEPDSAESE